VQLGLGGRLHHERRLTRLSFNATITPHNVARNNTPESLFHGLPFFKPSELAARLKVHRSTIYRWKTGEAIPRPDQLERLGRLKSELPKWRRQVARFTFIDLFAGIGGMRLGLEAIGGKCIYSCEIDRFARETYLKNFGVQNGHAFSEDINEVEVESIPDHDLLVAGFPCQPFSVAGVSKKNALGQPHGFKCENQGNLFFRIRDILAVKRPPAFLLENVKNLKSHDKGDTFRVIENILRNELGYEVQTRIINAKGWLPQNRERIFLVGFRDRTDFCFDDMRVRDPQKGPRLSSILESDVERRYVLTSHLWTYLRNYADKHRALGHGFGYGLVTEKDVARTLSARYYKDGSEILISRGKRKRPRRLTPRECARLMGFDDRFRIPVSDTQAYKQFGNAVAVPVIKKIGRHMLPHLLKVVNGRQPRLPKI